MARSHMLTALAAATVLLLTTSYLISTLGLPELDFLNLRYASEPTQNIADTKQIPLNPPAATEQSHDGQTQYLLGVGKADITGYSH